MTRSDPTLASLVAFEASVRLGSMSAAARELGTTQPAVSQRVRHLEDVLGLPLFDRTSRRSCANADGRAYYDEVEAALRRLQGASSRMQARASARGRELSIAVHFGFAHLWLLPRLTRLESAFPGTAFEVLPMDRNPGDETGIAALTIRFDSFAERGADERPLIAERVYPVCSPATAEYYGLGAALASEALQRVPLLHMDDRDPRWLDWARWRRLAGLKEAPPRATFHYRNYPLLLNAAIEGRGLALGWHGLVDGLIAAGTLRRLGPEVSRQGRGYLLGAADATSAATAPIVGWFERECRGAEP